MKYLLTLEKFKSNILTKVFKIVNSDARFKIFLNDLLEHHGIKISELTDEYFKYIPVSKISKGKKEIEIKEDEYKIVDDNGKFIDGSIEEGDFLIENDGYVHKVESLRLSYANNIDLVTTDVINISTNGVFSKFFKIPKKYSNDLILSDYDNNALKISGDQVWKYKSKGELKTDILSNITPLKGEGMISSYTRNHFIRKYDLKQLIKYYKYDFEYKDSDIVFGFDLTNTIQYYSKGSDVELQDLKESSDYVIIFNIEKAIENLSNVKGKREERKKGKEGSPHFMKDSDILKMNRERLISKLTDRYKLSEKDVENLKEYTDFKRIFSKIVSKNPVLVLEDNSIWELVINIIETFKNINQLKKDGYYSIENIKREIEVLNEHFEKIISHPLVINKVNLFEGIRKYSDESVKVRISNIENDLLRLGNQIQSYFNNFEYDNLNDIYIIFNKIKSYRDISSGIGFFLSSDSIGYKRMMVSDKHEIEQVLKDELVSIFNLSSKERIDYIQSNIKTLIKVW